VSAILAYASRFKISKEPKMRLRWKKHLRETGLAAVGANPNQGSYYHDGENEYATVYPSGGSWNTGPLKGWYWVARVEGQYMNTCNSLEKTEAEAKKAAEAWVKERLK
jgi:hypothetical protein